MEGTHISGGAIQLARLIQESDIWISKPSWWLKVWIYILQNVNFRDTKQHRRGSNFFTYKQIYDDCCLSNDTAQHGSIANVIRWLKKRNMIATVKTTRGMVVTVLNYDTYQKLNNYKNNTPNNGSAKQEQDTNNTGATLYKNNGNNGNNNEEEREKEEENFPSNSPISEEEKQSYYAGDYGEEFDFSDKDFDLPYKPPEVYCMEDHFVNCTSSWVKTIADGMPKAHPDSVEKLAHRTTEEWIDSDNWQEFQEIVQPFIGYPWKKDVKAQDKRDGGQEVSEIKSA